MLHSWVENVFFWEEEILDLAGIFQITMLTRVELEVLVDLPSSAVVKVMG